MIIGQEITFLQQTLDPIPQHKAITSQSDYSFNYPVVSLVDDPSALVTDIRYHCRHESSWPQATNTRIKQKSGGIKKDYWIKPLLLTHWNNPIFSHHTQPYFPFVYCSPSNPSPQQLPPLTLPPPPPSISYWLDCPFNTNTQTSIYSTSTSAATTSIPWVRSAPSSPLQVCPPQSQKIAANNHLFQQHLPFISNKSCQTALQNHYYCLAADSKAASNFIGLFDPNYWSCGHYCQSYNHLQLSSPSYSLNLRCPESFNGCCVSSQTFDYNPSALFTVEPGVSCDPLFEKPWSSSFNSPRSAKAGPTYSPMSTTVFEPSPAAAMDSPSLAFMRHNVDWKFSKESNCQRHMPHASPQEIIVISDSDSDVETIENYSTCLKKRNNSSSGSYADVSDVSIVGASSVTTVSEDGILSPQSQQLPACSSSSSSMSSNSWPMVSMTKTSKKSDITVTKSSNSNKNNKSSSNSNSNSNSYSNSNNGIDNIDNITNNINNKRTNSQYHKDLSVAAQSKKKRRRIVVTGDADCNDYVPPRKPVVKASEVYVKRVYDASPNLDSCDDDDGHYIVKVDTDLTPRYHITRILGQGTFGKVVEAYDRISKSQCAIKIIRAVPKYRDASRIELRVLSTLHMYDKQNLNKCIHMRECFDYRNHVCIVTDLLGISVFDFMKANQFLPFPGSHVQSIAWQILKSVAFLHDLNLVHTDLKPENILLVDSSSSSRPYRGSGHHKTRNILKNTSVRLIDFGSAIFSDEYHSSVISTRHYRAPEIILGIGWSFPCDIWSIGCILVEFCTGEPLYQTHDNLEHLALMQRITGKMLPKAIIRQASRNSTGALYVDSRTGCINYPDETVKKSSKDYVNSAKTFEYCVRRTVSPNDENKAFWDSFIDLLSKIFVYDPEQRITAQEALNHPWFTIPINDHRFRI